MDDYYVNYMETLKNEVKHMEQIEATLTDEEIIEIRSLLNQLNISNILNPENFSDIPELLEKLYIICLEYLTKYKTNRNKKIEGLITRTSTSHTEDELEQLSNLIHTEQHNSEISKIYEVFIKIYSIYIKYKYIPGNDENTIIREIIETYNQHKEKKKQIIKNLKVAISKSQKSSNKPKSV